MMTIANDWRASRAAGLDKVPVIVRDLDVIQQMEIALIENLQREDLNPIEVAQGIQSLMKQCGYTQETVANRLSKSRPAVANLLRLLGLPAAIQQAVIDGAISAGHARVLAGIAAQGETLLHDPADHLMRGYEGLERKLQLLGADVHKQA